MKELVVELIVGTTWKTDVVEFFFNLLFLLKCDETIGKEVYKNMHSC